MPAWFSKTETEPCLNPVYATRTLACPHCNQPVEAAVRAVTLRCCNCHKQLQFQDAIYSKSAVENVTTLGQVRINRKAALRGRVDCGSLLVQGSLDGSIHVRGDAHIDHKAAVSGTLSATHLVIEPGGSFRGTLCIGDGQPREHAPAPTVSRAGLPAERTIDSKQPPTPAPSAS